jgi:hypothetical protein
MNFAIPITIAIIIAEAFMKMRYGFLFHKHLCENYPDKRYLTILDLKGEINGFKTLNNLFNDSEQELNDNYLTLLKKKSRFWFLTCLFTMVALPVLITLLFGVLKDAKF